MGHVVCVVGNAIRTRTCTYIPCIRICALLPSPACSHTAVPFKWVLYVPLVCGAEQAGGSREEEEVDMEGEEVYSLLVESLNSPFSILPNNGILEPREARTFIVTFCPQKVCTVPSTVLTYVFVYPMICMRRYVYVLYYLCTYVRMCMCNTCAHIVIAFILYCMYNHTIYMTLYVYTYVRVGWSVHRHGPPALGGPPSCRS